MGKAISKRHIQVSGGRATGTDGKKDKPTTTPTAGSLISIPQIEVSVQKESQSTDTCDDVAAGKFHICTHHPQKPLETLTELSTRNVFNFDNYQQTHHKKRSSLYV